MEQSLAVDEHLDERQFQLAVRRLADSLNYGTDPSPYLGSGIEYEQSRLYIPGDPVKSIDWRVTARTGRAHVKEYAAPKQMPMVLLVDTSASMSVSSGPRSKYAWAVQLAGGLALAALARMSPVAVVGCGERFLNWRPSLSRVQIFQWLHELRRVRYDEKTRLAQRVRAFAANAETRSLVVVLSDLCDPGAGGALKRMAQEHDTVVLHLQDPAETGRLRGGIFRVEEAETGAAFVAHGRTRWSGPEAVVAELRSGGVDYSLLRTDRNFVPGLREFLRRRDSLGRGQR